MMETNTSKKTAQNTAYAFMNKHKKIINKEKGDHYD